MPMVSAASLGAGATCGYFRGNTHILPLRVYYEDTDSEGIVYYANYLKFAERGRTEMLRCRGFDHNRLLAESGLAFAVRHCVVDYISPARLDDMIEVCSVMTEVGGASATGRQIVRRDGVALVRLEIRLACIGRDGRPGRMPPPVRALLAELTVPDHHASANSH